MKKRFFRVVQRIGILTLIGLLYAFFIKLTRISIPCVFYEITGKRCPGCGSTRMMMAFIQGKPKEAVHYNIGVVILLPFLFVLLVWVLYGYIKTGKKKISFAQNIIIWIMVFYLIVYTIIRNIIGI